MSSLLALSNDQLGLSFVRGLVASINPCGFVLLPTYLMYFLGIDSGTNGTAGNQHRASMRRALLVGAAVSAGFLSVFVVVGYVADRSTRWINEYSRYATAVVGVGLVGLGIAMLAGYRPPISTARLGVSSDRRTVRSMFVYGIAYAVASIGCTIGLFVATMFGTGRRDGTFSGVANGLAYGAGMTLVVMALTVTLAFAKSGLVRWLRSAMTQVQMLAAVFVLISGLYLLYYFWVVDLRSDTDPLTSSVDGFGSWLTVRVNDHWELVAVVLAAVVGAALAAALAHRGRPGRSGVG
ncbi:cytochrome c biogenesis CcdA family protein [soil metagenome]